MRLSWVSLGFAVALGACDNVYSGGPSAPPDPGAGSERDDDDAGVTSVVVLDDPVIEHHNSPMREGLYVVHGLTRAAAANLARVPGFEAKYTGVVDGQPLYVPDGPGHVGAYYVVTESNDVRAIAERDGHAIWTTNVGLPASRVSSACVGVNPFGITGTPVIDLKTRTIYVDAIEGEGTSEDAVRYSARHRIHALSIDDGKERDLWPVDPDGVESGAYAVDSRTDTQRGAMALVKGTLYVPYGAVGDCGPYHGTVVAIDVAKPTNVTAWIAQCAGGGVWSLGGVMSDGENIFFSTANSTGPESVWNGSEMLARFPAGPFSSRSTPADFFVPGDWRTLDSGDVEIQNGLLMRMPDSTPSLVAIEVGKDGFVYGFDAYNLGGKVGATPLFKTQVVTRALGGASAAVPNDEGTMLVVQAVVNSGTGVDCPEGQAGDLVGVQIVAGTPPTAHTAWCAQSFGHGSPIITTTDGRSEAIAWVAGASKPGRLRGFDAKTGEVVFDGGAITDVDMDMSGLHRFSTLIAANGRLVVAADNQLHAFTF